jgi:hypothetical protein
LLLGTGVPEQVPVCVCMRAPASGVRVWVRVSGVLVGGHVKGGSGEPESCAGALQPWTLDPRAA